MEWLVNHDWFSLCACACVKNGFIVQWFHRLHCKIFLAENYLFNLIIDMLVNWHNSKDILTRVVTWGSLIQQMISKSFATNGIADSLAINLLKNTINLWIYKLSFLLLRISIFVNSSPGECSHTGRDRQRKKCDNRPVRSGTNSGAQLPRHRRLVRSGT